jgi:hypothetical protein
MIEDAPLSPIFWIPPVKACWEDSRWKGGFADCIEHAVVRSGTRSTDADPVSGYEFREFAKTHPALDELIGLARIGRTGAAGLETAAVLALHVRDRAGPAVPIDLLLGGAVGRTRAVRRKTYLGFDLAKPRSNP